MKIFMLLLACLTIPLGFAQDEVAPPLDESQSTTASVVDEPIPTVEELGPSPRKKDSAFAVRGLTDDQPATNQSIDEMQAESDFNHRKSNWVASFGFEGTRYEIPYEFDGDEANFDTEERELWGGRLGFGRDFYLGGGLIFGARLEGYYMGTLFTDAKTADPEFDLDVASEKNNGHVYGADAIAHLGWMFDFQTKNPFLGEMTYLAFELFVEAGIGKGKSYQNKNYRFDAAPATDERYNMIMEDEFTSAIASAGLNVLSTTTGAFLYLRASRVSQSIDKREIRGKSQPNGQAAVDLSEQSYDKSPDTDPLHIFALGGGLKF